MPVSLLVSLAVRSMHASPRSAADCLDLPKSNSSNYLGVPVTIESGDGEKNGKASFYEPIARYIYSLIKFTPPNALLLPTNLMTSAVKQLVKLIKDALMYCQKSGVMIVP